jgi:beta-glucanase (GH16 family)
LHSTPRVARTRKIRAVFVALVVALLAAGAFEGGGAAAAATARIVYASDADTGVIDLNGDGVAEWNSYGPTNNGMAVGEQRCDGCNLKYMVPFTLTDATRAAVAAGASARLHFRVWIVSNLGAHKLVLEAMEGGLRGRDDFVRPGLPFASVTPAATPGGVDMDVDVTALLRAYKGSTLTFRFRLDTPGTVNGVREFVNVATMESGQATNRPQLVITPAATAPPTPASTAAPVAPTTPAPTSAPTTSSTTTTPTTTAPTTTKPRPPVSPPNAGGWRLSWSDEFNGASLDTTKWNYAASTFGDGNREIACLQPGNVAVSAGSLKITARRERTVCPKETRPQEFPAGRPWTSGMIDSSGKFAQARGRFEIRAKLPKGRGFWPAFWMTSQNAPFGGNGASGEIDVFEAFGASPTDLLTSVHWFYPSSSQCPNGRWGCSMMNKHTVVTDMTAGFHTYAVEWESGRIAWFFDGAKVFELGDGAQYRWGSAAPSPGAFSVPYPQPFTANNPMKLRVNLAVGGTGGAPDASTPVHGTYEVDYVRVYTR